VIDRFTFRGLAPPVPRSFLGRAVGDAGPDFTIEYQSVTNSWGTSVVAILVPNAAAIAAGVRFELAGEPAGFAVSNG
jgi:hypothetical protein